MGVLDGVGVGGGDGVMVGGGDVWLGDGCGLWLGGGVSTPVGAVEVEVEVTGTTTVPGGVGNGPTARRAL